MFLLFAPGNDGHVKEGGDVCDHYSGDGRVVFLRDQLQHRIGEHRGPPRPSPLGAEGRVRHVSYLVVSAEIHYLFVLMERVQPILYSL